MNNKKISTQDLLVNLFQPGWEEQSDKHEIYGSILGKFGTIAADQDHSKILDKLKKIYLEELQETLSEDKIKFVQTVLDQFISKSDNRYAKIRFIDKLQERMELINFINNSIECIRDKSYGHTDSTNTDGTIAYPEHSVETIAYTQNVNRRQITYPRSTDSNTGSKPQQTTNMSTQQQEAISEMKQSLFNSLSYAQILFDSLPDNQKTVETVKRITEIHKLIEHFPKDPIYSPEEMLHINKQINDLLAQAPSYAHRRATRMNKQ